MKQKIHHKMTLKTHSKNGWFSGYASVFNVQDLQNDWVEKGAFEAAIREGPMPKMLWQHDPTQPIGRWEKMEEHDHGLYVEGQLFLALEKGREAFLLMKEGVLDGLSIGYEVRQSTPLKAGSILSDLVLHEVSLVTFPANPAARITDIKQREMSLRQRVAALSDKIESHINQ